MVFSSVPVYLDPPNWHHQQLNQVTGSENPQQLPPVVVLPSAAEASHHHVAAGVGGLGGRAGSIIRSTAGSMAADHRARSLGNNNNKVVQQPEVALNCPRCNSTNTKFCYFNNYSLSQPRHFCKTCRRYWTRGGALRNVPVGGGCRRNNKKSKSSSSKSSSANNDQKQQQQPQDGNSNSNSTSTLNIQSEMIGHLQQQQPQQQQAAAHHDLPLMATLHNLSQYNHVWNSSNSNTNVGFSFLGGGSSHGTDHVDFQVGSITNSSSSLVGLHQFPFFEAPNNNTAGIYSFQNENENDIIEDPSSSLAMAASNSRVSDEQQLPPVKMKDHHQQHNNQYNWSSTAAGHNWTDLSGLNHTSPATTIHHHLL